MVLEFIRCFVVCMCPSSWVLYVLLCLWLYYSVCIPVTNSLWRLSCRTSNEYVTDTQLNPFPCGNLQHKVNYSYSYNYNEKPQYPLIFTCATPCYYGTEMALDTRMATETDNAKSIALGWNLIIPWRVDIRSFDFEFSCGLLYSRDEKATHVRRFHTEATVPTRIVNGSYNFINHRASLVTHQKW